MNSEGAVTHLNERGEMHMVEVGHKPVTMRRAVAEARVGVSPEVTRSILEGVVPKGDVGAVVRMAGIMAAKRTAELVPLCHPLPLSGIEVNLEPCDDGMVITAEVRTTARTGVEMEAMSAVSVAALALYDMIKGLDRGVAIGPIQLLEKGGGRSGEWRR
ncbi:MAG: cyclic pyranopterin monophosphate synthase MoaC [bacterium]|nr:cyclic pyranopterin monophosphate synthase MoaC [Acidimicrobiia bacterium]MCY4650658.1 cyclic pyranopterin monophosphate synthase MoaC [bacterium]